MRNTAKTGTKGEEGDEQCCIQKMWLGGQTEFPKCRGGGKGVYDVLTLQKSRGARAHLGGQRPLHPPKCSRERGKE